MVICEKISPTQIPIDKLASNSPPHIIFSNVKILTFNLAGYKLEINYTQIYILFQLNESTFCISLLICILKNCYHIILKVQPKCPKHMPELPEVETTCRGIKPSILNCVIEKIVVRNFSLRWPISKTIDQDLTGQHITNVTRRAKYILIQLDKGTLILHLGMSGKLHIVNPHTDIKKHDHVDIVLNNQKIIRFNDARRFGSLHFTEGDPKKHKLLIKLGVEPLSNTYNAQYLFQQTRNKKASIKQVLMNHNIVVGIGNIYACETLFLAKINPKKSANNLTLNEIIQIVKFSKKVLNKAIIQGGTTLKDFLKADGKPGYFQNTLTVYGREKESCNLCGTPITKITQGQRSTFFCHICQD